jgi:hypothetical protein
LEARDYRACSLKRLAKKYVADYNAAHSDSPISEGDAETAFMKQALRQVDDKWASKLGQDDGDARAWLAANASITTYPMGSRYSRLLIRSVPIGICVPIHTRATSISIWAL